MSSEKRKEGVITVQRGKNDTKSRELRAEWKWFDISNQRKRKYFQPMRRRGGGDRGLVKGETGSWKPDPEVSVSSIS